MPIPKLLRFSIPGTAFLHPIPISPPSPPFTSQQILLLPFTVKVSYLLQILLRHIVAKPIPACVLYDQTGVSQHYWELEGNYTR